jgi:uncharacterized protein
VIPDPFRPAWPIGSRHLQTLWPVLLRRRPSLALRRERWRLPDGDTLSVHFAEPAPTAAPDPRRPPPAVLVVHGLEGSVRSQYVSGLLQQVTAQGARGVAFDLRTCGLGPGDPPNHTAYHAGKTDDLDHVVRQLRARWGAATPLAVVGFSLGGNMVLKWLGELGPEAPVTAAVAVSVPFDLAACAAAIDGPGFWNALYRRSFMKSLRRKALAMAAGGALGGVASEGTAAAARLDHRQIRACRTFADFDGQVTARLFGFADAQDYWARCSARGYLHGIRRPTLLVAAADDPFVPALAIPRALIAGNPALTLWLTERGGHVGFVGGSLRQPRYAAEEACLGFLRRQMAGFGQ